MAEACAYGEDYYYGKKDSSYVNYEELDAKRQFRSVLGYIKENQLGGTLLDVGCAMGLFLGEAKQHFDSVEGCDISEFALGKARQMLPGITFRNVDIEHPMPYPEHSFDVVTCLDVLEHTERFSINFRRMAILVKPGGHLIVSMPIDGWPRRMLGFLDNDKTHISILTEYEIMDIVKGLGLEAIRKRHFSLAPWGYKVRYVPAEIELVLRKPVRLSN